MMFSNDDVVLVCNVIYKCNNQWLNLPNTSLSSSGSLLREDDMPSSLTSGSNGLPFSSSTTATTTTAANGGDLGEKTSGSSIEKESGSLVLKVLPFPRY